jgi:hypothetical protein
MLILKAEKGSKRLSEFRVYNNGELLGYITERPFSKTQEWPTTSWTVDIQTHPMFRQPGGTFDTVNNCLTEIKAYFCLPENTGYTYDFTED